MTFIFTTKHAAFIERMRQSEEHERKGYELLLATDYFLEFFKYLAEAEFFASTRMPGPTPGKEAGYVRIPYWAALDFLEASAQRAAQLEDIAKSIDILNIVRKNSRAVNKDGQPIHNYHTSRKFAEILATIPTALIEIQDVELIAIWLSDPYDRGLVCSELDKGLLKRLLTSNNPKDWAKAVKVLEACMEIVQGKGNEGPRTLVEDYWLKALLKHHVVSLGKKAGLLITRVFRSKLSDMYASGTRAKFSYLFRPAVEDHQQNHEFNGADNRVVEGLRDVLISWFDQEPVIAAEELIKMLVSDAEMERRVAIHCICERWPQLRGLLIGKVSPWLFQSAHLHELYRLLKNHFGAMSNDEQAKVLAALNQLPADDKYQDPELSKRQAQIQWLSAIKGQGCEAADVWYAELSTGANAIGISKNPDFHSYMEMRWGDGDSPYKVEELLAFAQSDQLVRVLNDFVQLDRWDGPSTRSLVNTLEQAVKVKVDVFMHILPQFLNAKREYQYGLISGMKLVLDDIKSFDNKTVFDWDRALNFLTDLLAAREFWQEKIEPNQDMIPTRDWIPGATADLLRAGMHDDRREYPHSSSAEVRMVLEILLANSESLEEPTNDPMTAAINSPKGKAVEALFSFALKECREAREIAGDRGGWEKVQALFDSELEKTAAGNYEFSTLAAAYLLNLKYLSQRWLEESASRIFPLDEKKNFEAAIGGLAYSQPTIYSYRLLNKLGVIDATLASWSLSQKFDARMVERIALAYLWGDETLDGPKINTWFQSSNLAAIEACAGFFRQIRGEKLSEEHESKVLAFLRKAVEFCLVSLEARKHLLSTLGTLACYFTKLGEEDTNLLVELAKYVHVGYNESRFISELVRLCDMYPVEVHRVLVELLNANTPSYDFEDGLKLIVQTLYSKHLKEQAIRVVDQLRHLNGFPALFLEFSQ